MEKFDQIAVKFSISSIIVQIYFLVVIVHYFGREDDSRFAFTNKSTPVKTIESQIKYFEIINQKFFLLGVRFPYIQHNGVSIVIMNRHDEIVFISYLNCFYNNGNVTNVRNPADNTMNHRKGFYNTIAYYIDI